MSSKRLPLSSNPNAVNSPYRVVAVGASKQKRSYATLQREESYGHPPPAKKQMIESHQSSRTSTNQHYANNPAQNRPLTRTNSANVQTFEKASTSILRESPTQQQILRAEKIPEERLDSIEQWRKYYKKSFPKFVFYFESIPQDVRARCVKYVAQLGAREEKFFSNAVTHVVTTRDIPAEREALTSTTSASPHDSFTSNGAFKTINPSLLSATSTRLDSLASKGGGATDMSANRRLVHANELEIKRHHSRNVDVLHRARDLGMKIWALEKLQRMLNTMFQIEMETPNPYGHDFGRHAHPGHSVVTRAEKADLSQLLRSEKINGPLDRDPTVAAKDLNVFKGPFIYIHDVDENVRPIMVREYPKVATKELGDWPQFRSVAGGKCPFIDDVDHNQRELDKERDARRLQRQQEKEKAAVPRTSAATPGTKTMNPPKPIMKARVLAESDGSNKADKAATETSKSSLRKPSSANCQEAQSRGRQNAFVSRAAVGRLFGGEPVASGLQQSNMTSAIRSNMVSSTAAQPGAKTGMNKEIHGLQRKILEKNSGGIGSYGLNSSHTMPDLTGTAREEGVAHRRGFDKLGQIEEGLEPSRQEVKDRKLEVSLMAKAVQKRKHEKRDSKPGYCENCQDKFEDFEEHILSRKHRKFAEDDANWKELDCLLANVGRRLKDEYSSPS